MAGKRLPAGITQRADGRLMLSFTHDSKRYCVYGKTIKECREKEIKKRLQVSKRIERRENPTFSEYAEQWQINRGLKVKEATTRHQRHILGQVNGVMIASAGMPFGDLKIKRVEVEDLREVQRALFESRSAQTVNDYMALIKHILKDALKERIIDYNPGDAIENLKRERERARDTVHRALTHEEQARFFHSPRLEESFYNNIFRFAILTGMRSGEIGALKYKDIRGGKIHIERTLTRTEAGGYEIGSDAKTTAGRRTIPITDDIKNLLEKQKAINEMLYGNVISMDSLVFRAPMGGLLSATAADREIRRVCRDTGIERFTMHAFRATFATRCIEAGMNPKTIQELLGHSNFNLTMSLYGHVLETTKKEDLEKVKIII